MAITGVVGSGKTLLLWRIQDQLRQEGQIEVAESLVFDVPRVTLNTLKLALYYDLATDKDGDLTGKPEKSERALLKVMHRAYIFSPKCPLPSPHAIIVGRRQLGKPCRDPQRCGTGAHPAHT